MDSRLDKQHKDLEKAISSGDYSKAFEICDSLISNDDCFAYAEKGKMYLYGKGLKKDYPEAVLWLEKAVEMGMNDPNTVCDLFDAYWNMDTANSRKMLYPTIHDLAAGGNPKAVIRISHMYRYGKGAEKNLKEAVRWLKTAIDSGPDYYRIELFDLLWQINTPESSKEMIEVIKPLIDKGELGAIGRLGRAYFNGRGVEVNYEKAAELLRKSAESVEWAKYELFDVLWKIDSPNNYSEMIGIVSNNAEKGEQQACIRLARSYYYGKGVKKDPIKAVEVLKEAVSKNKTECLSSSLINDLYFYMSDENYQKFLSDRLTKQIIKRNPEKKVLILSAGNAACLLKSAIMALEHPDYRKVFVGLGWSQQPILKLFDDVIFYDLIVGYFGKKNYLSHDEYLSELVRVFDPEFDRINVDPAGAKIIVGSYWSDFAAYVNLKGYQHSMMEESPGHTYLASETPMKKYPSLGILQKETMMDTFDNPRLEYAYCSNNVEKHQKIINYDVFEKVESLSTENKSKLIEAYNLPQYQTSGRCTLILTQWFSDNTGAKRDDDGILLLYGQLIDYFCNNDENVVMKCHPADPKWKKYSEIYNDVTVIDVAFPSELISLTNLNIDKFITVSSTSILAFPEKMGKKVTLTGLESMCDELTALNLALKYSVNAGKKIYFSGIEKNIVEEFMTYNYPTCDYVFDPDDTMRDSIIISRTPIEDKCRISNINICLSNAKHSGKSCSYQINITMKNGKKFEQYLTIFGIDNLPSNITDETEMKKSGFMISIKPIA